MSKIDILMQEINKEFKEELFHKGLSSYDYERIPFTSPRLNYMTYGGIPMGKLTEFYGEEHGGKTTTALDIIANYQRMENARKVAYADLENSLDPVWATKLDVDLDEIYIFNPTNQGAETIFEKLTDVIDTGEIGLLVIDSLGVMLSNLALGKSIEDKTYGGIAMALTNFSKKAAMLCHKYNCTLIGINQMRDDLNSMYGGQTTTGGRAWKHNCSVRIEFRKGKLFDENYKDLSRAAENPCGNYVMASMTKNKTAPSNRKTGFYTLNYQSGIDYLYDLIEVGMKYGIVDKSGGWFKIVDVDTGEIILDKVHGQTALYEALEENMDLLEKVEKMVDTKMKEQ